MNVNCAQFEVLAIAHVVHVLGYKAPTRAVVQETAVFDQQTMRRPFDGDGQGAVLEPAAAKCHVAGIVDVEGLPLKETDSQIAVDYMAARRVLGNGIVMCNVNRHFVGFVVRAVNDDFFASAKISLFDLDGVKRVAPDLPGLQVRQRTDGIHAASFARFTIADANKPTRCLVGDRKISAAKILPFRG